MWQIYHWVMRSVSHFDMNDWMVAFAVAVGLGVFCLRGFGSRSNY